MHLSLSNHGENEAPQNCVCGIRITFNRLSDRNSWYNELYYCNILLWRLDLRFSAFKQLKPWCSICFLIICLFFCVEVRNNSCTECSKQDITENNSSATTWSHKATGFLLLPKCGMLHNLVIALASTRVKPSEATTSVWFGKHGVLRWDALNLFIHPSICPQLRGRGQNKSGFDLLDVISSAKWFISYYFNYVAKVRYIRCLPLRMDQTRLTKLDKSIHKALFHSFNDVCAEFRHWISSL